MSVTVHELAITVASAPQGYLLGMSLHCIATMYVMDCGDLISACEMCRLSLQIDCTLALYFVKFGETRGAVLRFGFARIPTRSWRRSLGRCPVHS